MMGRYFSVFKIPVISGENIPYLIDNCEYNDKKDIKIDKYYQIHIISMVLINKFSKL
jgi:hypothetical protein